MRHTPGRQEELVALLRACKQEPDDPELRLVLADWLEEHGPADLAECVRQSIAAEGLLADDPREEGIAALVNDPRRPAGRWLAPLRALFPHTTFHRGLLRVTAAEADLLRHRPDDVPAEYRPWLETLRVTSTVGWKGLAPLADAGWLGCFTAIERVPGLTLAHLHALSLQADRPLGHVASLDLGWSRMTADERGVEVGGQLPALRSLGLQGSPGLEAEGVRALIGPALIDQLTSLDLGYCDLGVDTVSALARSERAGQLRSLVLDGNKLGGATLAELGQAPGLPGLRSLSLVGCGLTGPDLGVLERWRGDRPLHALDLWGNAADAMLLDRLARWPGLREVRRLKVDGGGLNEPGWEGLTRALEGGRLEALQVNCEVVSGRVGQMIADCSGLSQLRSLSFPQGAISPEALAALARSPQLGRLEHLGLSWHRLGESGYRALTTGSEKRMGTGAPIFPALQSLNLSRTLPARAGLDLLLRSRLMERLLHVHLRENRLGPAGAKAIAAAKSVGGLKFLGLWTCSLKDEGVEALAGSPHLAGLRGLDLQKNNISDRGAQALARSARLGDLAWLSLRLNRLTGAGVRGLVGRPGGWARLAVDHCGVSREAEARARGVSILG